MNSAILDSSVLIDCLRGHVGAVSFLRSHTVASKAATHLSVIAELLAGTRNLREQTAIDKFLASFDVAYPNETDGLAALGLYRRYRLSNGVDWPDCEIAATAFRFGVTVFTRNVKHFAAFTGLTVIRPY